MKPTFLCTTLAAALFASSPSFAAEAPKPVTVKAPSARMQAFQAVNKEWTTMFKSGSGNPVAQLDKLVAQPHSPATSALLMQAFGVPALVSVKPADAAAGKVAYSLTMPAQQFAEVDGETLGWSALDSRIELDKDGRTMFWKGVWPSLNYKDATAALTMTDMAGESSGQRGSSDVWIGKTAVTIAQMMVKPSMNEISTPMPDLSMVWDAIDVNASVAENGKKVDIAYEVRIKAIKMMGEQLDDMRIATRITNVDYKAFEDISLKMAMAAKPVDKQDIFGGNKKQYIAFAKSLASNGTTLHIDELSTSFHGHKLVISGMVSLSPLKDADFKTAASFGKKVNAHLQVKVPVALVTEIAAIMTRQQAKAKGNQISEEAVAQTAQMITDGMIGKMTSSGFTTLQDGVLTSTLDFKGGVMSVNGKVVELPKAKPVKKAAK